MAEGIHQFSLVSFNYSSFRPRYLDILFFNSFLSQGYNILYVDCSLLYSSSTRDSATDSSLKLLYQSSTASLFSVRCISIAHLSRILHQLPEDVIVNLQISWEWRFNRIFEAVRNSSRPSYYISTGHFPIERHFLHHYANRLYRSAYRIKQYILSKTYPSTPSLIIGSGSISCQYYPFVPQVQSPDYLYLCKCERPVLPKLPDHYFLYIDQGWPFHPDFTTTQKSLCYDPILWQQTITHFLGLVEQTFSTRVVIALHPSCKYPSSYYSNFHCVTGSTHDLIYSCSGVIAHFSTALSLAIRLYKPILLLSHSLNRRIGVSINRHVRSFSQELNCPIYSLGSDEPIPTPSVDPVSFNAYIEKYLYSTGVNSVVPDQIPKYLYKKLHSVC